MGTATWSSTMATNFNASDIITLIATSNPKLPQVAGRTCKAAQRFMLYKSGMSVAQYKAAVMADTVNGGKGYAAADLAWDTKHGFIKVTPVNVAATPAAPVAQPEPAAKAAPAKVKRSKRK